MGFTASSEEVNPVKARLVVVADVVVALPMVRPLTKVEDAGVQMLALARLREAMTLPVVGEMVRVESEFDTDETAPDTHVPLMLKQPFARLRPLANDEDAAVEVMFSRFAARPPVKVEVEVTAPNTFKNPWSVEVPVVAP